MRCGREDEGERERESRSWPVRGLRCHALYFASASQHASSKHPLFAVFPSHFAHCDKHRHATHSLHRAVRSMELRKPESLARRWQLAAEAAGARCKSLHHAASRAEGAVESSFIKVARFFSLHHSSSSSLE